MSSKFDTRSRWYTVVGDEVLYLKARKQRFNGRLVDGMDRDELLRMVAVGYDIVGLVPNQACVHGSGIPFPTALLRLSRCVERLSR